MQLTDCPVLKLTPEASARARNQAAAPPYFHAIVWCSNVSSPARDRRREDGKVELQLRRSGVELAMSKNIYAVEGFVHKLAGR